MTEGSVAAWLINATTTTQAFRLMSSGVTELSQKIVDAGEINADGKLTA